MNASNSFKDYCYLAKHCRNKPLNAFTREALEKITVVTQVLCNVA